MQTGEDAFLSQASSSTVIAEAPVEDWDDLVSRVPASWLRAGKDVDLLKPLLAIFKEDSPWNLLAHLTVACKVYHLYSACQVGSAVRLNLDHDNSVLKSRMKLSNELSPQWPTR